MWTMEHGSNATYGYSHSGASAFADDSVERGEEFGDIIPGDIGSDGGFEDGGECFLVSFRGVHDGTI
jgi:hypothetical protein